ncbi:centrosomal protein of 44 kDa [Leuresthes tenuis]|uniref:centrosomal protein of 44 kDa n=1 Tax=Leuresthes tenuis TaxID=355514 RepID=UPI003B50C604
MFSTGDVQSCLRKLETLLRVIKYPGYVDYSGLSKGDPSAFLPIVSFTLTSFSPPFAAQLIGDGLEVTGKTDLRFTDTLYKVLRDVFHYKPILTKQQFLLLGFSQRKISFICDVITLVLQKHKQLIKPSGRWPASHSDVRGNPHPIQTDATIVSKEKNHSTLTADSSHAEEFTSYNVTCTPHIKTCPYTSPGNLIAKLPEGEEHKSSEVDGRLSALEAQLETLLSGLNRLIILEKRMEELEKCRNTDKNDGQVVTISRESWENLTSRVLLLETKLELSNSQIGVSHHQSSTSSDSSSSNSNASKVKQNNSPTSL